MGQTKIESLIEALINIAIGYFIGVGSQMLIFPMFDIYVSTGTNFMITAWFTAISLARSYIIRRWFNKRLKQAAHRASVALEGM